MTKTIPKKRGFQGQAPAKGTSSARAPVSTTPRARLQMDAVAKFREASAYLRRAFNLDGWANLTTGTGVRGRDKSTSALPAPRILTYQEQGLLYRSDRMLQKICTRPVRDMFREGYKLTGFDDVVLPQVDEYLKTLCFNAQAKRAMWLARVYGGALMILGIDDGLDPAEELDKKNIRSIEWLAVLDRYQASPFEIEHDIGSTNFGLPRRYIVAPVSGGGMSQSDRVVHHSRCIRFEGLPLPDVEFVRNNYWGQSYGEALWDELRRYAQTHANIGTIIEDFAQAVFKLKNLSELIGNGQSALVRERFRLMEQMRSNINAMIIDGEGEEFTRQSTSVAGLSDLVRMVKDELVAASDMPHTTLLGEGSQGNTSGRSEEGNYYDLIAQEQHDELKPRILAFLDLAMRAEDGPTLGARVPGVDVEFNPLEQLDEKEEAETRKTRAETDEIYIRSGVLDSEEVAKSRFGGPRYGTEIALERLPDLGFAAAAAQGSSGGPDDEGLDAEDEPAPPTAAAAERSAGTPAPTAGGAPDADEDESLDKPDAA